MSSDVIHPEHHCPWCAFVAERLKPVLSQFLCDGRCRSSGLGVMRLRRRTVRRVSEGV